MIKLTEKYWFTFDSHNYILMSSRIVKNKKSPNYGKETEYVVGYYSRLSRLLNALIDKELKDCGIKNNYDTIIGMDNKLKDIINEVRLNFDNTIEELKQQILKLESEVKELSKED